MTSLGRGAGRQAANRASAGTESDSAAAASQGAAPRLGLGELPAARDSETHLGGGPQPGKLEGPVTSRSRSTEAIMMIMRVIRRASDGHVLTRPSHESRPQTCTSAAVYGGPAAVRVASVT